MTKWNMRPVVLFSGVGCVLVLYAAAIFLWCVL